MTVRSTLSIASQVIVVELLRSHRVGAPGICHCGLPPRRGAQGDFAARLRFERHSKSKSKVPVHLNALEIQ